MSAQRNDDLLGMNSRITRRDFFNGALAASGAALIAGCGGAESETPWAPSGSPWTGFGGVGDYAWSNGNTQRVVDDAHGIRDRLYVDPTTQPVDEEFDLVIVGGGFSGMTAAYEFSKRAPDGRTCLLLDNHPVVGGEAKQNEFDVDGQRLIAPQGSNGAIVPLPGYVRGSFGEGTYDIFTDYYQEFGLPTQYELEPLGGGAEKYALTDYHFAPMAPAWEKAYATGYHFPGKGWVDNPTTDGFSKTPWAASAQKDLNDFVADRRDVLTDVPNPEAWLDTLTYYELLDKLGYGNEVRQYIDPGIAVGNYGVSGSGISAYAAHRLRLPGTTIKDKVISSPDIGLVSFPGGNTAFMRIMLNRMIPGAIRTKKKGSLASVGGTINSARLDQQGNKIRIRTSCTAFDIRHSGDPATADHAIISYVRNGEVRRARAKTVVMAVGGWVNRNIVADMPDSHREAYSDFHHGPVMVANVALRNWRFFDKLGYTNTRWFDALGWQTSIRRNVVMDNGRTFTPDSPTVLTFYIPFLHPELPGPQQGAAGRAQLFTTSYSDFERQLREQLTAGFAAAGFDAKRDIAGIVLNRWGHAYVAPQPGFYFGRNGAPPPSEVIRKPHGRIVFAHSELLGEMSMAHAMHEAYRAAGQIMDML
ncbi:NAD(P)-binding protein [Hyphococcus sp. DH-69]|uniref:NAD(P)-binding protein n=1 Tax=Hyphococcus formosus TaxID=3143534 RepID=UPI00398B3A7D